MCKPEWLPPPQYVQIFWSVPLLMSHLPNQKAVMIKIPIPWCWGAGSYPRLPQVQIMSLSARSPLYFASYSYCRKINQISWAGSDVCWWVNTLFLSLRANMLSLVPNCHTSIVHMLLAEDLKQCRTSWAVTLCDNFTRSFSFQNIRAKVWLT